MPFILQCKWPSSLPSLRCGRRVKRQAQIQWACSRASVFPTSFQMLPMGSVRGLTLLQTILQMSCPVAPAHLQDYTNFVHGPSILILAHVAYTHVTRAKICPRGGCLRVSGLGSVHWMPVHDSGWGEHGKKKRRWDRSGMQLLDRVQLSSLCWIPGGNQKFKNFKFQTGLTVFYEGTFVKVACYLFSPWFVNFPSHSWSVLSWALQI